MSSKNDYSKKIIKILEGKPAMLVSELTKKVLPEGPERPTNIGPYPSGKYGIKRSLKGLKETGQIETFSSGQNDYARLTKEGKKKMHSLKLDNDTTLVNTVWDGFWRIIILDLPEERKNEREALRYLLKKANFACVKNTVWVSPYPYEHLFENIKKDLGLGAELMIIITDKLDAETKTVFLNAVKK